MSVTVYGDARSALAVWLREQLAGRLEAYARGVTVETRTPERRTVGSPPLVVLDLEPGTIQQRANMRSPLRISVWSETEDDVHDLTQLVHGLLLTHSGPIVRSVLPAIAPWVTADPDTGEPLGSCTLTVNTRPRLV